MCFRKLPGRNPCGANPAPAYHKGMFYCTSQHTTEIFTADAIDGPWNKLAGLYICSLILFNRLLNFCSNVMIFH